jgi:microsomal prostaglandin-E synthase 2
VSFDSSPFCCKVRAYLNYNRIPYDIVEVNSVTHSQTKWSLYNKVPIVVLENEQIQLNDSSMIISAIESYLRRPTATFKHIMKLYQCLVEKDQRGELSFTYADRYAIVEPSIADRLNVVSKSSNEKPIDGSSSRSFFGRWFSSNKPSTVEQVTDADTVTSLDNIHTKEDNDLERQWRQWVDDKFVHVVSPNIYCTFRQSLHTFQWFSRAGDWEEIFPWYQRWIIIYLGSIVMRAVAIHLKKKYHLNDDVRISLYECGHEWANAIGNNDFLGKSTRSVCFVVIEHEHVYCVQAARSRI